LFLRQSFDFAGQKGPTPMQIGGLLVNVRELRLDVEGLGRLTEAELHVSRSRILKLLPKDQDVVLPVGLLSGNVI
jgi:hypothetical protein